MIGRDSAVKAHTQAISTLRSTLVTASDELRAELEPLTDFKLIPSREAFGASGELRDPEAAMGHVLGSLARRWVELHEEIKIHTCHLKQTTKTAAPELVEAFGIGFDSAAELLLAAGDHSGRIRSEAAFAKLCEVCPIPASSGRTTGRHRISRGGNRQANAALYRIVIVRMRWHEPTKAYVEWRTAEALSKKDTIRCLKRDVAREVYHLLPPAPALTEPLDRAA